MSFVEKVLNEIRNRNWRCVGVHVIGGAAVLCYHKFYSNPNRAVAHEQMFPAEANSRSQNYELALNGDGNVLGFSQVIDEYGSYAGDAAFFHAGVCELQHGKYE